MSSRNHVLNRVKVAIGATDVWREAECLAEWQRLARHYRRIGKLGEEERLALFDERVRHYNGTPF